jgi:hypothetical protein
MDVLSEVYVKHLRDHGDFLCVNIYAPDTQQLTAQMFLCRVFGFETEFSGGRFQNYSPLQQPFAVTINRAFYETNMVYPGNHRPAVSWFGRCLEWIATEVAQPWSFSIRATMEFADSEPDMWFGFSFTDVDDAVLFKLKFA